ncbi:MAG TPA: hypothetical protein VLW85_03730 [Myxococcales bacterium]|nr:hypothetical protein [Myxococcales bacterium]
MRLAIALVLIGAVACGGNSSSPPPPDGAVLTLSAAGVSQPSITIPSGGKVTFTNNDTAAHQIVSTDCGELASPSLSTGQTFSATLLGPKTCTYKDGLNPGAAAFDGTISVSGESDAGGSGY